MTNENEETPDRLADQIHLAVEFSRTLKFDKRILYHQMCIGLFLGIIERAEATLLLVKSDKVLDAKAVLRAMFEAVVELINLRLDPTHLHNIKYDYYKQRVIQLSEAKKGNKYLKDISKVVDIDQEILTTTASRDVAEKAGGKSMSFESKFAKIGWKDEYDAIYRSLSSDTHPTYGGMINRQFDFEIGDQDFEVTLFRSADAESRDVVLHSARVTLKNAVDIMQGLP